MALVLPMGQMACSASQSMAKQATPKPAAARICQLAKAYGFDLIVAHEAIAKTASSFLITYAHLALPFFRLKQKILPLACFVE